MKKTLIIAQLFVCSTLFAQNLISNGSFEEVDSCYYDFRVVKNWHIANGEYNLPPYFSVCNTFASGDSVPENSYSYQYPEDGNAYIAMGFYLNYQVEGGYQYIQTKIVQPLITKKNTLCRFM